MANTESNPNSSDAYTQEHVMLRNSGSELSIDSVVSEPHFSQLLGMSQDSLDLDPDDIPRTSRKMSMMDGSMSLASLGHCVGDEINDYEIVEHLQTRSNASLYVARDKRDGQTWILKAIKRSAPPSLLAPRPYASSAEQEMDAMKRLRHRHVIGLREVIDDEECDCIILVLAHVQGPVGLPTKDGTCDPVPPPKLRRIFSHVVSALAYLHKKSWFHRDIKPDNILVDTFGNGYLADFGETVELPSGISEASRGTLAYWAPEMISFAPTVPQYHAGAADVWALGITFLFLLTGEHPLFAKGRQAIAETILNGSIDFSKCPQDWAAVLKPMLHRDPCCRATIAEIAASPFLVDDIVSPSSTTSFPRSPWLAPKAPSAETASN